MGYRSWCEALSSARALMGRPCAAPVATPVDTPVAPPPPSSFACGAPSTVMSEEPWTFFGGRGVIGAVFWTCDSVALATAML